MLFEELFKKGRSFDKDIQVKQGLEKQGAHIKRRNEEDKEKFAMLEKERQNRSRTMPEERPPSPM